MPDIACLHENSKYNLPKILECFTPEENKTLTDIVYRPHPRPSASKLNFFHFFLGILAHAWYLPNKYPNDIFVADEISRTFQI